MIAGESTSGGPSRVRHLGRVGRERRTRAGGDPARAHGAHRRGAPDPLRPRREPRRIGHAAGRRARAAHRRLRGRGARAARRRGHPRAEARRARDRPGRILGAAGRAAGAPGGRRAAARARAGDRIRGRCGQPADPARASGELLSAGAACPRRAPVPRRSALRGFGTARTPARRPRLQLPARDAWRVNATPPASHPEEGDPDASQAQPRSPHGPLERPASVAAILGWVAFVAICFAVGNAVAPRSSTTPSRASASPAARRRSSTASRRSRPARRDDLRPDAQRPPAPRPERRRHRRDASARRPRRRRHPRAGALARRPLGDDRVRHPRRRREGRDKVAPIEAAVASRRRTRTRPYASSSSATRRRQGPRRQARRTSRRRSSSRSRSR